MNANILLVAPEAAESLSVLGMRVDILATGADTNGVYAAYQVIAEPGQGNPPHVHHNEEETFFVQEGTFEVLCGDTPRTVTAGSLVVLPRGIAHAFRCVGETQGKLLGIATPAGHEKFFQDAARLTPEDLGNIEKVIGVCARHGIEIVPPAA
jgi:quercetin dioxygenase-like cupin family protein